MAQAAENHFNAENDNKIYGLLSLRFCLITLPCTLLISCRYTPVVAKVSTRHRVANYFISFSSCLTRQIHLF
jgi:hypothetical protein